LTLREWKKVSANVEGKSFIPRASAGIKDWHAFFRIIGRNEHRLFEGGMHSSFDITSINTTPSNPNAPMGETIAYLLQQILDIQQKQLAQLQATAAAQDAGARWRNLVAKWKEDFPDLPAGCKQVLPILERAYGSIVATLVDELTQNEEDGLNNDFTMQDFIDRYGMKLGQLGNILNLVGPLAETLPPNESQ
jgi:hypothetical protein